MKRLKSQAGTLIPLTIVLAIAILGAGLVASMTARIALAYIQTSHIADTYAIHAAHRAANGLNACEGIGEIPDFRVHECRDDGEVVELALVRGVSAAMMSFDVIGRARIGYQKFATEGFYSSGSP